MENFFRRQCIVDINTNISKNICITHYCKETVKKLQYIYCYLKYVNITRTNTFKCTLEGFHCHQKLASSVVISKDTFTFSLKWKYNITLPIFPCLPL